MKRGQFLPFPMKNENKDLCQSPMASLSNHDDDINENVPIQQDFKMKKVTAR